MSLSPASTQAFAAIVLSWANQQLDAFATDDIGAAPGHVLVMLNEGLDLRVHCTSSFNASASSLLQELVHIADEALCPNVRTCNNTASECDPSVCGDITGARHLQLTSPSTPPFVLPTPPTLPLPTTPPSTPQLPPSMTSVPLASSLPPSQPPLPPTSPPTPPPPAVYETYIVVSHTRTREAGFVLQDQRRNDTVASAWVDSLARAPIMETHNITSEGTTVAALGATIQIMSVARNDSFADGIASKKFSHLLMNMSALFGILQQELGLGTGAIEMRSLRVEYVDQEVGMVTYEGSLPMPPPSRPPAPPALTLLTDSGSSSLTMVVTPEAVEQTAATVQTVVQTAVVAGVGAAVVSSVASAVASSVASATASAAASAAASGAAVGAGGGAVGGAGGGVGGLGAVMPLIFGAQRFGANGGLAVEKSELQSGVADLISTGPLSGNLFSAASWFDDGEANATVGNRANTTDPPGRRLTVRNRGRNEAMIGTFVNMGIVCGTVLAFTLLIGVYWKHRMNHKYFRQKRAVERCDRSLKEPFGTDDLKGKKQAKFIGLPGLMVFPSAFVCARTYHSLLTMPHHPDEY